MSATRILRRGLALLLAALAVSSVRAEDPCAAFTWDVRHERAIFASSAQELTAGRDPSSASTLRPDALYQLTLLPQSQVAFAAAPGKSAPLDGTFAGLAKFIVPVAGTYRIAADQGLWLDVAFEHALIGSAGFQGRRGCSAPHKIVQFELPAGEALFLQLSGATNALVRIAITRGPT